VPTAVVIPRQTFPDEAAAISGANALEDRSTLVERYERSTEMRFNDIFPVDASFASCAAAAASREPRALPTPETDVSSRRSRRVIA